MRVAGGIAPGAVPKVLGHDADAGCFAMEYLDPVAFPVWKHLLATGSISLETAAAIGDVLGRIHAATADRPDIARRFRTDETFYAIRLEPYLVATGRNHADLAGALDALVTRTAATQRVLVHGDFSPKNILIGPDGPVILDAECAWFGDPAFDVAFVLNHLLLKGAWHPEWRERYLDCVRRAVGRLCPARRLGSRRRPRRPHRRPAAGPAARAHRRQVAGRVPHRGAGSRSRAAVRGRAGASGAALPFRHRGRLEARAMSATEIARIHARRVWDSRGRPTVEAEVTLACGAAGRAIAPAGASRGSREAVDLRDGGARFGGMDVQGALANVNGIIARMLTGADALDQGEVDGALLALDGTHDKSRLGGNAMIAVSLAVLHAAAATRGIPLWRHLAGDRPVTLPLPEIQIFGGGAHAGRRIDVQDLMVMPVGADSFAEALAMDGRGLSGRRRVDAGERSAGGRGRRGRLVAGVLDQ